MKLLVPLITETNVGCCSMFPCWTSGVFVCSSDGSRVNVLRLGELMSLFQPTISQISVSVLRGAPLPAVSGSLCRLSVLLEDEFDIWGNNVFLLGSYEKFNTSIMLV